MNIYWHFNASSSKRLPALSREYGSSSSQQVIPIVKSTAASRTATTAPLAGAVVPSETPRPGRRGKATAAKEDEDKTLEAKRTVPITAAISAPPSAPCEGCKVHVYIHVCAECSVWVH